jgi:ABC-2 type transport system permease protein
MSDAAAARTPALAPLGPIIGAQAKTEFLRLIRVPAFTIPVILFPIMFFALFGLPFAHMTVDGINAGAYTLASFGAYAVISVALFSFGITVANDRGQKTTVLMRATPLPPIAYLTGKVIATLAFATIAVGALFIFGAITAGVHLAPLAWLALLVRLLVGVFPFITLGFAVGYLAGPNSAVAILQLINLPMSFASGLFAPLSTLPPYVQSIAHFLPAYHYGQLAWNAMGAPTEPMTTSVVWLSSFTVVFLFVAVRAYYREETKTFG